MIAINGTIPPGRLGVVRNWIDLAHLMEQLRHEAASEVAVAFEGISGKKIDDANIPDCGRHGVSRAINGSATNPLFRIAGFFILLRRLGLGRERALRMLDWLREVVDRIWPPEESPDLQAVLDADQELDVQDEVLRHRAARGCKESARQLIEVKRRISAHTAVVVRALVAVTGGPR